MQIMELTPGQHVQVRTAFGNMVVKRAVTGVIDGESFRVVRVCSEDEWELAQREGRAPTSSPWPAEDVLPA